jgi:Bacterial regulatory proteins, gntR family
MTVIAEKPEFRIPAGYLDQVFGRRHQVDDRLGGQPGDRGTAIQVVADGPRALYKIGDVEGVTLHTEPARRPGPGRGRPGAGHLSEPGRQGARRAFQVSTVNRSSQYVRDMPTVWQDCGHGSADLVWLISIRLSGRGPAVRRVRPGQRLPGINHLMQEYGVTHLTANKALRLLVTEGPARRAW